MTREEEIHNFIKDSGICDYKYDDLLDHNEYGGGDVICAFIEGVEWADNNPNLSSLWHESREEPKGNEWTVLCQDKYGAYFLVEYRPYSDSDETWDEYVNSLFISKWVYIKDILPKKEL